jgi:hypothetical protein
MPSISELERKRDELLKQIKEAKQAQALPELREAVKGNNVQQILNACYRFTAQYRTKKPKSKTATDGSSS